MHNDFIFFSEGEVDRVSKLPLGFTTAVPNALDQQKPKQAIPEVYLSKQLAKMGSDCYSILGAPFPLLCRLLDVAYNCVYYLACFLLELTDL